MISSKISFLIVISVFSYDLTSSITTNVIPDCPRDDGWTCQWDVDYWKATSNVSAYENITVTYEEIPTRRVTIVCDGSVQELPRGFLNNFTLGATIYFRFLHCPPPAQHSLGEILDGQTVRMLRFTAGRDNPVHGETKFLDYRIFNDLPEIIYISLTGNSLTSVKKSYFQQMSKLEIINLKDNQLTELSGDVFEMTPHLVHLELGNNNLTRLNEPIVGLKNLQTLNVYQNRIDKVSVDFFESTPSLKSIDLQGNHLETLPSDVFRNLTQLKTLRLFSNRLTKIPSDLLRPLQQLEQFDISDNPELLSVPVDLFQNLSSSNLTEVNLRRCGLRTLPLALFKNFKSLRILNIDWNNLTELQFGIFSDVERLEELDLSRNKLESIPSGVFNGLTRLKTLKLNRNHISSLVPSAFYDMTSLTNVDLSRNKLTVVPGDLFKPTVHLEVINFGYNAITNQDRGPVIFKVPHTIRIINLEHNRMRGLPSAWITENTLLVHLNLNHNLLDHFDSSDCQPTSDNVTIDLRYNNITRVFIDMQWANILAQMNSQRPQTPTVLLGHNPLVCDCLVENLLEYVASDLHQFLFTLDISELECQTPAEMASLPLLIVQPDQLICTEMDDCPEPCICRKHAVGNIIEMDCRQKNLTALPIKAPFNVSVLRMDDNQVTSIGNLNRKLWNNLTELYLRGNKIRDLNKVKWLPNKLQLLDLRTNGLKTIEEPVLKLFDKVVGQPEVWLQDNLWRCDCSAKEFKEWLNVNGKRVGNLSTILCHPSSNGISSPIYKTNICPQMMLNSKEVLIGATVISLVLAVVLAMAGIGYYRFQREIKVWLFAHQWCLWFVTETELDREKTYDAFISFSQEDAEFVASYLLPGLEKSTNIYQSSHEFIQSDSVKSDNDRPTYKVCIHYRDWLAGEWIPDQIIRSVQDSRRTIVVLSKNFIKSVWGRLEFKAAHHQALQDRTNRIIMVVLGELPPPSEMDPELKMYVKFNTYLKWGDPWFWQKLRYAMPHRPLINLEYCSDADKLSSSTTWSTDLNAISSSSSSSANTISVQPKLTILSSNGSSSSSCGNGNSSSEDKMELVRTK